MPVFQVVATERTGGVKYAFSIRLKWKYKLR